MTDPFGKRLISAIVLALDEAAQIESCLRTLAWAGELLVVVDSRTTDDTLQIAERSGARVVIRPWDHYAGQRNFALSQAGLPWVLFVDADERVPLELADDVRRCVAAAEAAGEPAGFWIPRQNLIMGRWVQHAGWYPDYQLRLFRRDRGRYDPDRPVHELVLLDGADARLEHHLVHHNYHSWAQFWRKQRRYASMEARALHDRRVRLKAQNFVLQPLRELRRRYWTLRGYRDGSLGLALSLLLAAANFLQYVELWRLERAEARR